MNIQSLPTEILTTILDYADPDPFELRDICQTSRQFRAAGRDNVLWETRIPRYRIENRTKTKPRDPGALAKAFCQDYRAVRSVDERLMMRAIWRSDLSKTAIYSIVSAFPKNHHIVACAVEKVPSALFYASNYFLQNKKFLRAALLQQGSFLAQLPSRTRFDRILVQAAVSQNGHALKYASSSLRDSRDIVKIAIRQNADALKWASDRLRNDKNMVYFALSCARGIPEGIGEDLISDPEIKQRIGIQMPWILATENPEMLADKEVGKEIVSRSGAYIAMLSDELRCDLELAKLAVENNGNAIWSLPEPMQKNKDLMLVALKNHCENFPQVCQNIFHQDRDLALTYVQYFPERILYLCESLKNDESFLLSILEKCSDAYFFVPAHVREDDGFVRKAIMRNPDILFSAPTRFCEDKELLTSAVRKNPIFILFAPPTFFDDADFMASVIEKEPTLFQAASIRLRRDADFRQRLRETNCCIVLNA